MLTPDNLRRYHGFKDSEAEQVAYFLLHTDEATRDEMLLRMLYHVHPKTVYKIRCCHGAETSRMQLNAVVMALYNAAATASEDQMPGVPSSTATVGEAE